MKIVFHANPSLDHHHEHALWFEQGIQQQGMHCKVTSDINTEADIHIISGPHYAKERWLGHPRVLLIDRAFTNDIKTGMWSSMDYVSLGWMTQTGGRAYHTGTGREPLEINDQSYGNKSIYLCGYGELTPPLDADLIRYHPVNAKPDMPLKEQLAQCGEAIGINTSALITAALMGLDIRCLDPEHVLNQPNWLELLAYTDWHYSDIIAGKAWLHLMEHLPPLPDQALSR